MSKNTETIVWHDVNIELPDSDVTVLIIPGGEIEAWVGYLDGEQWRYADGMPCNSVVWWAQVPTGPAQ